MKEQELQEELRRLILLQYRLEDKWCRELMENGSMVRYNRKSIVIERGYHNDELFIVIDGIWRAYFDQDDKEKTMYFAIPGDAVFSSFSYFGGQASVYQVESSNESVAWKIGKKELSRLIDLSEDVSHWFIQVLGNLMLLTEQGYIEMSTARAEDRYRLFARKMPYVLQSVPLKEIAAYLGVTPQSLSRIRAEMFKNKSSVP